MSTCSINKLLVSTVGVVLALGTAMGLAETALAQNGSTPLSAGNSDRFPNPKDQPVKVPEPATIVGLGLVAGSLVVTRRRPTKTKV